MIYPLVLMFLALQMIELILNMVYQLCLMTVVNDL